MERRERALHIANDLRNVRGQERERLLALSCGDDVELREEVLAILRSFGHLAADRSSQHPGDAATSTNVSGTASRVQADPETPDRIGKYRVLKRLGQGGFGVVYQAVSDDGLRKVVALKLLRPNVASPNAIRRFRRERQILPSLHHPNIAGFLDADETENGRPFFVMEYVEGKPITAYCDENGLTIRERLALFEKVCEAVQHAHARFVLHRDLKPSNILVDKDGAPKLLDFGIARLLSRDAEASADLVTIGDEYAMTPEYASPEQLRGDPLTIASDVYSLGVVLYELLTGHRPYELRSRIPQAAAKLVDETRVLPPSEKVKTTEEITTSPMSDPPSTRTVDPNHVATKRSTSVERLRRVLSGDLDNIVLGAMRKEPIRRYGSAQELVDDLRRHQDGQPVRARGDSWKYRAGKFLRRHRLAVSAGCVILSSLAAVAILAIENAKIQALVLVEESNKEKREAEKQLALAQSMLQDVLRRNGAFSSSLEARKAGLEVIQGLLDSVLGDKPGDSRLRLERAKTASALVATFNKMISGAILGGTELQAGALKAANRALEAWNDLVESMPHDAVVRAGRADALARRALILLRTKQADAARADADQAVVEAEEAAKSAASGDDAAILRRSLVSALLAKGTVWRTKDKASARDAWMRAWEKAEPAASMTTASPEDLEQAADAIAKLALLDESATEGNPIDRTKEARRRFEKSLELRRLAASSNPSDPEAGRKVLDSIQWTSRAFRDLGEFQESAKLLKDFDETAERLRPHDPDFAQRLSDVSRGFELRGHLLQSQGDAKAAVGWFAQAIAQAVEALSAQRGDDEGLDRRIQQIRLALASSAIEAGDLNAAKSALTDAEQRLPALATGEREADMVAVLASVEAGLGEIALREQDISTAKQALARAQATRDRLLGLKSSDGRYLKMADRNVAQFASSIAIATSDINSFAAAIKALRDIDDEEAIEVAALMLARMANKGEGVPKAPLCELFGAVNALLSGALPTGQDATKPRLVRAATEFHEARKRVCP